jgi:flagellar biosynthesis GTPase FlhF
MKFSWQHRLPFAEDLPNPWIDDAPASEQPDGGGGNTEAPIDESSDLDDESLGDSGKEALRRERQARKQHERELAQLKEQLKQVANINPELYKQTLAQAAKLKEDLDRQERETAEATKRIREKADSEVRAARQTAEIAERARIDLLTQTKAQAIFRLNKGLDEVDPVLGTTSFDAWWDVHGKKHLKWDNKTNDLVVVDRDGDPITEDGKPVDPAKWLDDIADKSPIVAQYFQSKSGEGSGGIAGARNIRTVQTRSLDELRKANPNDLLDQHYGMR